MKKDIMRHMQTAKLMIDGAEESMATWGKEPREDRFRYGYITSDSVHSKESVVRRLVQARQELLQVIRELQI